MTEPFIKNHHYNFIKRKTGVLQHAHETCPDQKVIEAVWYSTESQIVELFPNLTADQKEVLVKVSDCKRTDEFKSYLESLDKR